MAKNESTTSRQERAIALIHAGAVQLYPGHGYALAEGSKGATYTITRDGCTCPDFTKRGVGECKHIVATRALCTVYRQCQREARATGRVRLPASLARALTEAARCSRAASVVVPASAPLLADQSDLFNP